MPELPKPAELAKRGGAWFQCGAQQLHVGVEAAFLRASGWPFGKVDAVPVGPGRSGR